MDDQKILDLFFARKEQAIEETDRKYGGYCFSLANSILQNQRDADGTVSDTYMKAWGSIPPKRPAILDNRTITVSLADLNSKELLKTIRGFLDTLPTREHDIFLRRYFFVEESTVIANRYGMKTATVLRTLSRTRRKLKTYLTQEGYTI